MGYKFVLCMETLLCAAVGTANHQPVLAACTFYDESGNWWKNDNAREEQSL